MKRLLFMAALCAVTVLAFTPVALAQQGASENLNCVDFTSQEQAQAVLEANPNDPNNIDADGNGIACDEVFSIEAQDQSAPQEQYTTTPGSRNEISPKSPPPGADSPLFQPKEPDVAVLPDTGGPDLALLPLVGGVLLLVLGGVLRLAARRG